MSDCLKGLFSNVVTISFTDLQPAMSRRTFKFNFILEDGQDVISKEMITILSGSEAAYELAIYAGSLNKNHQD